MPFNSALSYLTDYTNDRATTLLKGKKIKWSTCNFKSYYDMIYPTFHRSEENAKWENTNNTTASVAKGKNSVLFAEKLKISFLAGCERDLRNQFCCGTDYRPKHWVDTLRFEFVKLQAYIANVLTKLKNRLS